MSLDLNLWHEQKLHLNELQYKHTLKSEGLNFFNKNPQANILSLGLRKLSSNKNLWQDKNFKFTFTRTKVHVIFMVPLQCVGTKWNHQKMQSSQMHKQIFTVRAFKTHFFLHSQINSMLFFRYISAGAFVGK